MGLLQNCGEMEAVQPLDSIGRATAACLRWGIPSLAMVKIASDDSSWAHDFDTICANGMAMTAFEVIRDAAVRDGCEKPPLLKEYQQRATIDVAYSLAAEAGAMSLLRDMQVSGIPFAVVKGPTMARFYQDMQNRTYHDIDIVVPPAWFRHVEEFTEERQFKSTSAGKQPWQWFDRYCREGVNYHGPQGANIDIHHRVPPWSFSKAVSAINIIERGDQYELLGCVFTFACAEDSLVISALHILNDLWKGSPSLASWKDLLVLIDRLGPAQFASVLTSAGLGWYARMLSDVLDRTFPEASIGSSIGTQPNRRLGSARLRALGWSGPSLASRHRMNWAMRLPVLNGLSFLLGSLVPSPAFIREHHGSYRQYWNSGFQHSYLIFRGEDFRQQ